MKYKLTLHLKDLEILLHDYTEWFMRVTRRIHYPNTETKLEVCDHSREFRQWLEKISEDKLVDLGTMQGLNGLHTELIEQANRLMAEASQFKQAPIYEDYDKLALYFEEFINRVRRLEKDCLVEGSGVDPLTGLRNVELMYKDITVEMERLSRQGKPFVLAMIRIDHFDKIQNSLSPENKNKLIVHAANVIKRGLRSFDDAYRIEENIFVLSLKQTGITGGMKALMRMRGDIEDSDPAIDMEGKKVELSLSSCVVEPMPSDSFQDLLANLREDLEQSKNRPGVVLQYHETSPLQRFIKESGGQ